MSRAGRLHILLACGGSLLLTAAGGAQTAPTFSLADSDITIDSGSGEGRGSLLLKADGLDAARLGQPLGPIKDLQSPLPPPLNVEITPHELPRTDNSRRWVLIVDIKGLPRNATQKRYLSVSFAGQDVTLPYTLTNKSTATFAWSIKGPPGELSLSAGDSIGIGIAVQAVPATHVRVMPVSLVEQSRKTLIDGGIVLCAQLTGACGGDGVNLDANSSNRLWLRTNAAIPIIGKYVGTVIVGADQKPDGETLNLTVYGTTLCRQLLGVLVILIGVVCAWVTTTWIQSRLNRAQALLPARLMAERVDALQQRMGTAPAGTDPGDTERTRIALSNLHDHLAATWLDTQGYLPQSLPLPFKGMDPKIDDYKHFLAQAGARIALLTLIVEDGFVAVWRKIPTAPNDASVQAIRDTSRALDLKGADDPPPASKDAITFIQDTLNKLDAALAAAHPGVAPPLGARHATIPSPTFEQLAIEVRNLSAIAWLVFGGLATVVGVYVLIISNLGFGVPSDYFVCLFWGFGLPVGSQQLVQSTIGSVGTAVGVSVSKTT
jgi:hypothetical protein